MVLLCLSRKAKRILNCVVGTHDFFSMIGLLTGITQIFHTLLRNQNYFLTQRLFDSSNIKFKMQNQIDFSITFQIEQCTNLNIFPHNYTYYVNLESLGGE